LVKFNCPEHSWIEQIHGEFLFYEEDFGMKLRRPRLNGNNISILALQDNKYEYDDGKCNFMTWCNEPENTSRIKELYMILNIFCISTTNRYHC
ncbi:hypothetical protein T4B_8938, partial [Trichinella pseudospiralis]